MLYMYMYTCTTHSRELQDRLAHTDQQMQKLQSWSLIQLVCLFRYIYM